MHERRSESERKRGRRSFGRQSIRAKDAAFTTFYQGTGIQQAANQSTCGSIAQLLALDSQFLQAALALQPGPAVDKLHHDHEHHISGGDLWRA